MMTDTPTLAECDLDEYLLSQERSDLLECPLEDCRHVHDPEDGPCLVVVVDDDGERPCGCQICPDCQGYGVLPTMRDDIERWCPRCNGNGQR